MSSTLSFQLLPGLVWPEVVVRDRVLTMSQVQVLDL